jgi:4-amino-4-deoxy-L-arabinose transferase-like glycosyltransferase
MKILGISAFALRIPALLAVCLATTFLFYWPSETRSLWTACLTVVLLLADPLWHTFARLGYTDMLLVAAMATALFAVAQDRSYRAAARLSSPAWR